MSVKGNQRIPAYDYRSGKDGAPYEGDFASTVYEHKHVAQPPQRAEQLPGPPAPGDRRPDGQRYHGGVVKEKKAYWY